MIRHLIAVSLLYEAEKDDDEPNWVGEEGGRKDGRTVRGRL